MSYRMPAEWEPHEGTLLTWPHNPEHWPGLFERVPPIWARMVKELEQGEDVHIVTHDTEVETSAKKEMKKAGVQGDRVHLHRIPSNFAWARDHGPIVVKNAAGERSILDWEYNAWGGQWAHDFDDQIPTRFAKSIGLPSVKVPMILEGGSIDVNGMGTLLTTEDCLLNPDRNPDLTREGIEKNLREFLGITNILWLGKGIMGDDTSGHVDDLTRFVNATTVVTIVAEDQSDPDYKPLQENLRRLRSMKDQDGNALKIVTIAQPKPVYETRHSPSKATFIPGQGYRIPASYANFYIANECVLLPVWDDPKDADATATLQKCFPTRRIVPIDSRVLTWGFGSFHCVTQQIPV
jgi:agmatine deiminase